MANPDHDGGHDVSSGSRLSSQSSIQLPARSLRKVIPTSKDDALRIASGSVNQTLKARAHLTAKGYLAQGSEVSYLSLALILFQIATEVKLPLLADNIKSVAFLLEDLSIDSLADRLLNSVESKLNVVVDALASTASGLDDQQRELTEMAAALTNAGTQLVETNEEVMRMLSDTSDNLLAHLDSHTQSPALPFTTAPFSLDQSGKNNAFTYAAVAQQHIPSSYANVVAKNDERAKQVIVQPASDVPEARKVFALSPNWNS
jgi:hypothetical protein